MKEIALRLPMKRAGIVLLAATLTGIFFNYLRPQPLGWFSSVVFTSHGKALKGWSRQDFLDVLRSGNAEFVDSRPGPAFSRGHLAGAMNLPADASPEQCRAVFERLSPETKLILYGADEADPDVLRVADFLLSLGYRPGQLGIFKPGWPGLQGVYGFRRVE